MTRKSWNSRFRPAWSPPEMMFTIGTGMDGVRWPARYFQRGVFRLRAAARATAQETARVCVGAKEVFVFSSVGVDEPAVDCGLVRGVHLRNCGTEHLFDILNSVQDALAPVSRSRHIAEFDGFVPACGGS